ncbi:Oidioi.mRNA.OKI2018_I69.PAR.g11745.t1.cds [Oikopleura dioica]|uniref:peptidylprolyl isomerase n=1 Tax=Oikopleura dioica TaxID=34765 RepID=A0ABN7S2U5_OIKDI|nr:Oidioi.mRNA.OKI2018_I69.PAR.g11745.t1.cds [Oikopleura dioica]
MTGVDVSVAQDGGILKAVLTEGLGTATPSFGSEVTVHYTGTLSDGSQFDSSRGRGVFKFTLGQGQVIKGWDEGVKTMKKGERSVFTLRPEYAYGDAGSPPKIPPNATLTFDIELITWKAEDISENTDGSILRTFVKKGKESWGNVVDTAEATVKCRILKSNLDEVVHDYGKINFRVGEAELANLPVGIDHAIKKMNRGDVARLTLSGQADLKPECKNALGLHDLGEYEYELELVQFEKVQEPWEMDDETKIDQAELAKSKGTERLKDQKFDLAIKHYNRVITLLDHQETKNNSEKFDEISGKFRALKLAAYLNLSLVYPKIQENYKAISAANDAIAIDPENEKAFFRRGTARMAGNDLELAISDFKKVVEINKENKTASKNIKICSDRRKKQKEDEKKKYAGKLFG